MKSANQMHYQQLSQNLQKQMQIFFQRLTKPNALQKFKTHNQSLNQITSKIKNFNTVYNKIQNEIKLNTKNKNYNQFDLKDKLRKYQLIKDNIVGQFENICKQTETLRKSYLFNKGNNNTSNGNLNNTSNDPKQAQMKNMQKAAELISRYHGVNNQLSQTQQITGNILPELYKQGQLIKQMKQDAKQAQAQLTMADQMMRIIKNRNLITKLILIVLIIFMAIANLLLLVVKLG